MIMGAEDPDNDTCGLLHAAYLHNPALVSLYNIKIQVERGFIVCGLDG